VQIHADFGLYFQQTALVLNPRVLHKIPSTMADTDNGSVNTLECK
jgi:hypothetical protein